MSDASVIDLAAAQAARGLVSLVPPADLFLPEKGKRVGDRVRECVAGTVGTVTGSRPGIRGFLLTVQFPHVTAVLCESAVEAVMQP